MPDSTGAVCITSTTTTTTTTTTTNSTTNTTNSTSCGVGNYLTTAGTCDGCDTKCLTCNTTHDNCTSCDTKWIYPYFNTSTCLKRCPANYTVSNYTCVSPNCTSPCATCLT